MATAVLAFWTEIAAPAEADFNAWYNRQHLPERLGVPGFRSGARYRSVSGRRRYFAFYETEGMATLNSEAYLARLDNPTAWTRRIMPEMLNAARSAFHVPAKLGQGRGGIAATLRFAPLPGRAAALERWLGRAALPALVAHDGVVAAQLWRADPAASRPATRERALRGEADAVAEWAVLVEGTDAAAVRAACAVELGRARLKDQGAASASTFGCYRLLYELTN